MPFQTQPRAFIWRPTYQSPFNVPFHLCNPSERRCRLCSSTSVPFIWMLPHFWCSASAHPGPPSTPLRAQSPVLRQWYVVSCLLLIWEWFSPQCFISQYFLPSHVATLLLQPSPVSTVSWPPAHWNGSCAHHALRALLDRQQLKRHSSCCRSRKQSSPVCPASQFSSSRIFLPSFWLLYSHFSNVTVRA